MFMAKGTENFAREHREILYAFARNLTAAYFLLLIMQISGIVIADPYISLDWLCFFVAFTDVAALVSFFMCEKNTGNMKKFIQHLFLVLLAVFLVSQSRLGALKIFNELLMPFNFQMLLLLTATGLVSFWNARETPNKIKGEWQSEETIEGKYRKIFQKLGGIPVLGGLESWALKEGLLYSFGLSAIILLGSFLRLYALGNLSFTTDEIYTGICIKEIISKGLPIYPDGYYYLVGFVHSYIGSFFALFFGVNELSARLPSALAGILTIPLLYFIGKEFGNRVAGIILAFSWALFPWAIEFARWGRYYSVVSFLFLATFYFSYRGFKRNDKKSIVIAIALAVLSIMNHEFGFLSPLIIISAFLLWNRGEISTPKKIVFLALGLALIPLIGVIKLLISGGAIAGAIPTILNSYNFISNYRFDKYFIDAFYSHFFPLVAGTFIYLGLTLKSEEDKIREALFLSFFAYAPLILVSYYNLWQRPRYLYFFMPLIISAALLGVYKLSAIITGYARNIDKKSIVAAIILLIFSYVTLLDLGYSFSIPFRQHGDEYKEPFYAPTTVFNRYGDSKSTVMYTFKNKKETDIVVTDSFQTYYFYTSEEPDYQLFPGGADPKRKSEEGTKVRYMSRTMMIESKEKLFDVIKKNPGKSIWLILNLTSESPGYSDTIGDYLSGLEKNGFNPRKVFTGEEEGALVYLITQTSSQP